MRGEFEKQVQQKMDELKLAPSDAVWQQVQKEIRPKSERKRIFIWIFFGLLITSGGMWLYHGSQAQKEMADQSATPVKPREPMTGLPNEQKTATMDSAHTVDQATTAESPVTNDSDASLQTSTLMQTPDHAKTESVVRSARNYRNTPVATTMKEALNNSKPAESLPAAPQLSEKSTVMDTAVMSKPVVVADQIRSTVAQNKSEVAANVVEKTPAEISTPASDKDTLTVITGEVTAMQKTPKRWQTGVEASAGVATLGAGISQLKAADPASSPSPGSVNNALPPAPERSGLALSAGLVMKRSVSSRISLSTGVHYQYYSTHTSTGQLVRRDTMLQSGFTSLRVEQYYRNAASPQQDYTNRYHFISLPVTLHYTFSKTSRFGAHAGMVVQQLVSTNALIYNQTAQVYYHSSDAISKTHWMLHAGLNYAVSNRWNIMPYAQIGLNALSNNKHLFAAGVRTQVFLK